MPRSNRPRRGGRPSPRGGGEPLDTGRATAGFPRRESTADGEWMVRAVAGPAATKSYRCPGCDHEIPAGTPHVVAWPADSLLGDGAALGDRRHWHSACWDARGRRGARPPRPGRPPRY